jgi:hypothetical protein
MEQIPCPCRKKSTHGNGVITLEAQPPTQAVQCRGRTPDKTKLAGHSQRVLRAHVLRTMKNELIKDQRVTQFE